MFLQNILVNILLNQIIQNDKREQKQITCHFASKQIFQSKKRELWNILQRREVNILK
jgi:hypothetical protein